MNPASVQPVEMVTARLLARPILQEYDAFHSGWAIRVDICFLLIRYLDPSASANAVMASCHAPLRNSNIFTQVSIV